MKKITYRFFNSWKTVNWQSYTQNWFFHAISVNLISKQLDCRLLFLLISSVVKWLTYASPMTCSLSLQDPLTSFFTLKSILLCQWYSEKKIYIYSRADAVHIITMSIIMFSIPQFLLAISTLKTLFSRGAKLAPVWSSRVRSESYLCSYFMTLAFSIILTTQVFSFIERIIKIQLMKC